MKWINWTLNLLLLVTAILAFTFGFLLFQRREGLRNRGEKLADTLDTIVKDLDDKSGTNLGAEIHRKEFAGPDGKTMKGGTLGWSYFHNAYDSTTQSYPQFDNVLSKVKKQTHDIREQRDILATVVAELATIFDVQNGDRSAFQNLATFEEETKALIGKLEEVRKRDDLVFSKLEEIATKAGIPLDKKILLDPEKFEQPLNDLALHFSKLKERSVNYSDALRQAVEKIDAHNFEVDANLLNDPNVYTGELTAMLNDFTNINEKLTDYEKYKVEFLETKDTLEKTIMALESSHDNLAALENKLASLETDYGSVKKRYNQLVGDTVKTESSELKKLEGEVLNVDYDWNYVIVNLGTEDNLPENLEMTVAREQEYICKVLVTRVFKNYAVAEILPKLKQGSVIEGDRVIF